MALVTGAGKRLGAAIAWALAEEGCDLVLHCRRSVREARALAQRIRRLGRRCAVLRADLSETAGALKLARAAERVFGRVDILVNSAAIFHATPLERLTAAELDEFLDINLKAPYILCGALGRRMQARGGGAIVNLACLSALRPWRTHVPYSISKAGVVALTVGLAKLLAPEVRVNAVAPGTVLPPAGLGPEERRALRRGVPLRRLGRPADVALAVQYLVGAPFVTGQVICVDGGRSVV